MEQNDSLENYGIPVHRSLMEKDTLFGIGSAAFFIIFVVTLLLVAAVSVYCIIFGAVALLACRFLCRGEPQKIDFLLKSMSQQDFYRG